MRKNKMFTVATLLIVLLVGMSACSKSSDDAASINKVSESDNLSKSTNDLSTDSTEKSINNSINNSESSESGDKREEEKQTHKINNPDNNTSTQDQAKLASNSLNTDASPSNDVSAESTPKTDSSEGNPVIVVSSGEKAIQYLKQQLPEGKDEDVSFGVDETLATDDHGSYYTVQLVSVSTRVSGKTGTLGYYKVYQDGVYKTF
ncbi:hypothetical protein [Fredinandcohnia onubensis]|uniref:hypothetical protein n=1 Tax=Fredinandcohnia onubensis TaxID=1571209 RepID=UPI000C0BE6D7|nr:hypothetical protein [Fredinandcohnia onubensis]